MANLVFYMTPGSCSTGIHILLEELELVFEVQLVNLLAGDQNTEAYRQMNPKGTIPVLTLKDGTPLTDFQSIAWWLAKSHPRRGLLPDEFLDELRALERMNYCVNQIHGQGFTRIFTTEKYSENPDEQALIQARGKELVAEGFALAADWLPEKGYLFERFSIADAALFYLEFWATRIELPLPEKCQAHYQLMLERPSVRQVLSEEGYGSVFR
ncbi:MAG: glutathione S-transferase family protein [Oceanobacter sp.]